MTISSTYSPDAYSGDGATTTFAITFPFLSISTNIKVSIKVVSTGVITEKTAATHYNVSGSNVVFTAGNIPASGETVIIELDPDFTQDSDYATNSALPAETLEADLDERCLESQINKDLISRAIRFDSAVDLSSFTPTLSATTADNFFKINSAGTGLELSTGTSVIDSLAKTDGNFYVGDGTTIVAESGDTARASLGVATTDSPQFTAVNLGHASDTTLSRSGAGVLAIEGVDAVTISATQTLTNKTHTDPVLNGTLSGTAFLDEDTMTSDSAIAVASQQSIKAYVDANVGISDVVSDTTPQLGGDLDVNGNSLVSTSNGDITLNPNGTGNVILGNYTLDGDQTVGAGQDNYVLKYDNGTGLVSLEAEAAGGISDVVDDTTPQLGGNLDVNGNKIVSASNGNIDIEPNGTGNVLLGNLTFDADQTVGAGQDNYVLTYDNGTGLVSLEAAAGGFTAATQAQQEAASDNTVSVTPAVQHHHPSAAKCWGTADNAGTLDASFNVTSVTDTGTGKITFTWDTDFSTANYAITIGNQHTDAGAGTLFVTSQAAGSCVIDHENSANGSALDPSGNYFVAAFGDQ